LMEIVGWAACIWGPVEQTVEGVMPKAICIFVSIIL
jgi:hypothetical protein